MEISALQIARAAYQPKLPKALQGPVKAVEGEATQSVGNQDEIKALFPNTYGMPVITFEAGEKKELPSFKSGDTITVAYRIKEGNKERIQQYRGVVIRISGHGDKKRFTVRKMSENVGVERIFPIESPFIESITVNKLGKVRRAKLYYLRALTGKKARIKEKRV